MKKKSAPMKIGDKDFVKLQAQWYQKLKDDGFNDLEWVDKRTGVGHDAPYLKKPILNVQRSYDAAIENHFRLCRNYLTHGTFETLIDRLIFELYTNGISYEDIEQEIQKKYNRKRSNFWIATRLKKLKRDMYKFNMTHPEGIRGDGLGNE